MSKKIYEKVDEVTFKVQETKTLKDTVECAKTFEQMAWAINKIKQIVWQLEQQKTQVKQVIRWYNEWVDILTEAKDTVKLAITVPAKIDLEEDFKLDDIDITKLPKIDIKREEPTGKKVKDNK